MTLRYYISYIPIRTTDMKCGPATPWFNNYWEALILGWKYTSLDRIPRYITQVVFAVDETALEESYDVIFAQN